MDPRKGIRPGVQLLRFVPMRGSHPEEHAHQGRDREDGQRGDELQERRIASAALPPRSPARVEDVEIFVGDDARSKIATRDGHDLSGHRAAARYPALLQVRHRADRLASLPW